MKVGDVIRLKQPFCPAPKRYKVYRYAVIVDLIQPALETKALDQVSEILVNLYDPLISEVYADDQGVSALYVFYPNEVESV
ncbi:MAG TPA: hypothetical protein V6D29_03320 [Leptolyngbyaceae cyanobacterium]